MLDMNPTELERSDAFKAECKLEKETPPTAIGGRFSYRLTPTGVGTAIVVVDNLLKKEKDVTDYASW